MRVDYEDKKLTEAVYRFYEEICAGRMYPDSFLERGREEPEERQRPEIPEKEEIVVWDDPEEECTEQDSVRKRSATRMGRMGRGTLAVLWCVVIALTFWLGRTRQEILMPGGVAAVLLTALLIFTRKKERRIPEEKDFLDIDTEDTEEDISCEIGGDLGGGKDGFYGYSAGAGEKTLWNRKIETAKNFSGQIALHGGER